MSARQIPEEAGDLQQQQLLTKARDLTLVTSRHAMPHTSSLAVASSSVAESGDATPWEPALRTATMLDAQPNSLVTDFSDPDHMEIYSTMLQDEQRPAAGQSVIASCPSLDAVPSSGASPPSPAASSSSSKSPQRERAAEIVMTGRSILLRWGWDSLSLDGLPNEILTHILTFLDVSDLLSTSRVCVL